MVQDNMIKMASQHNMNNNKNTSALTQALGAIAQGQQQAQSPQSSLFSGGQTLDNVVGPIGANGEYFQGRQSNQQPQGQQEQNPFYDSNILGNLIKANLQPTGYQGLGNVNAQQLQQEFQNFLGTLHNHFVQQIRNFNPFGIALPQTQQGQQRPQVTMPPIQYGQNPQQGNYIPPTGQPFGPNGMKPMQ